MINGLKQVPQELASSLDLLRAGYMDTLHGKDHDIRARTDATA